MRAMTTSPDPEWIATGRRLRWLREHFGFSQREFAEVIGAQGNRYGNWERGHQRLSLDGARSIKNRFGVSLDFLIDGDASSLPANLLKAWVATPRNSSSQ